MAQGQGGIERRENVGLNENAGRGEKCEGSRTLTIRDFSDPAWRQEGDRGCGSDHAQSIRLNRHTGT